MAFKLNPFTQTFDFVSNVAKKIWDVAISSAAPVDGQILAYNESNNQWEPQNNTSVQLASLRDSFVPISQVINSGYMGEKGQWSWDYDNNTLIFCIASNTWVNLHTLESIKIDNFLKIASLIDNFVPPSLVTSSNASGKKGQWSIQVGHSSHKGYFKFCIATDTWVRFEVDTLF